MEQVSTPATQTVAPDMAARLSTGARAVSDVPARMSIRDLDFYYGNNRALKGITLDLPEKRVTGMIGPSACIRASARMARSCWMARTSWRPARI
jgi:phosphate transport system ATP-binding protein